VQTVWKLGWELGLIGGKVTADLDAAEGEAVE